MNVKARTIEVDAETADALEVRAGERGMSVGELVALGDAQEPADDDEIAELDRCWAAIEAGEHSEVARLLETWGTPAFKPSHKI